MSYAQGGGGGGNTFIIPSLSVRHRFPVYGPGGAAAVAAAGEVISLVFSLNAGFRFLIGLPAASDSLAPHAFD